MRIVIATPLFPPDIEEPAPYVKELARRLAKTHEVTLVLYGHLPETVPNVRFVCVDKRRHLIVRLFAYTRALLCATHNTDVIIAENGPSVELPLLFVSLFTRTPYVFHRGDVRATEVGAHDIRHWLTVLVTKRAHATLDTSPCAKPEVLPFAPYPTEAFKLYETQWCAHCAEIEILLRHA